MPAVDGIMMIKKINGKAVGDAACGIPRQPTGDHTGLPLGLFPNLIFNLHDSAPTKQIFQLVGTAALACLIIKTEL
jgi:hypothetical protein